MVLPDSFSGENAQHATSMSILKDASLAFVIRSLSVGDDASCLCDEEYTVRNFLAFKLLPMLQDLVMSTHEVFTVIELRNDVRKVGAQRLGRRFLNCLRSETKNIFEMFPNSKFNPYFDTFYRCIHSHDLLLRESYIKQACGGSVPNVVDRLNACIAEIRSEVNSADFRLRLKAYRRPIKQNYDALVRYTSELFARHSRMVIVRVDLSYLERYRSVRGVSGADVCHHRAALLKELQSGRLGPLLGYAWKLEMGRYKGYHIHAVFYFDSSVVCRDVILGKRIGQYWDRVVTDGMGSHYNCNARKERYPKCFLG
jgi:hypothetical protein